MRRFDEETVPARAPQESSRRAAAVVGSAGHQAGHPLELILARNLISLLKLPGILADSDGQFVFFNAAAGEEIGAPFEEIGELAPEQWNARYGPVDAAGEPVPPERLPLATAVRESRPAYGRYFVRGAAGLREIEMGALPLAGPAGYQGAILIFWPLSASESG